LELRYAEPNLLTPVMKLSLPALAQIRIHEYALMQAAGLHGHPEQQLETPLYIEVEVTH
jgi:hypothetical protein